MGQQHQNAMKLKNLMYDISTINLPKSVIKNKETSNGEHKQN